MRNTIGTITDPHTAWMLLRSLETLELRMTRAGESAAKVCTWLKDHPGVERIGYLGFLDPESRQADIYRRHCTGAGSTFSLYLKGDRKSVGWGQSVSVRVDLGGRSIITKKHTKEHI